MVEHALLFRTESNFYFISYIVFNMIIHLSNVKKADMQNKKKKEFVNCYGCSKFSDKNIKIILLVWISTYELGQKTFRDWHFIIQLLIRNAMMTGLEA